MTQYNSPTQLYRDTANAKIMGVCAGIADYLDVKPTVIRVIYVIGTLFTGVWPGVFLYFIMGYFIKPKPKALYGSDKEETFWKRTRTKPDYSAAEMHQRFRDLERRTAQMESELTSKRHKLDMELAKLADEK